MEYYKNPRSDMQHRKVAGSRANPHIAWSLPCGVLASATPLPPKKNKTNALPRSESSTTRPEGWTIKPSERWHKQMNDKGLAYYLDLETGKSHWFPPCERCYKVRYTNRFVFWSHSTSFLCLCFSGSLPVVTQTRRYAANTSPPSPLRRLDWFNTFVDLPM